VAKNHTTKYGAIDIGTNAARLLIGEIVQNEGKISIHKLSYTRVPLRLGDEVFGEGFLSDRKINDFVKTIQAFKLISEIFEVNTIRAVATSAMREAKNAALVQSKIAAETGIQIEVISGDEEAELIYGAFYLLDFDKSLPYLVIDIGGGSTEISVFENGKRVASKSFQIGTIRLLKDKVKAQIWEEINTWIAEFVSPDTPHEIFGTGGNINKVHKLLGAAQNEAVGVKKMTKLLASLSGLTLDERCDKFQLKPDRADVIVPALQIYLHILTALNATKITVPKIGLSDGMLHQLYLNNR
jgi:exopolyphosphatase/guanosine-5'-triphosphate,3'-diphosphate pyrophosphatase